ncbi:hypothetical protein HDU88_005567 [Geranomyces variabilis]|nr:hypothetical protein HDU88_005567 [Geranomyces variabilis]
MNFKVKRWQWVLSIIFVILLIITIVLLATASCDCNCGDTTFTIHHVYRESSDQCRTIAQIRNLNCPIQDRWISTCSAWSIFPTFLACCAVVAFAAGYVILTRRIRKSIERRKERERNLRAALQPVSSSPHGVQPPREVGPLPPYQQWHDDDDDEVALPRPGGGPLPLYSQRWDRESSSDGSHYGSSSRGSDSPRMMYPPRAKTKTGNGPSVWELKV